MSTLDIVKKRWEGLSRGTRENPAMGTKEGVDEKDLAQTGWGLIFAFKDF